MQDATEIRGWYTTRFEHFEEELNGGSNTPLHALRREAFSKFTNLGFPSTADEDWRFTNVAPIAGRAFLPVLSYNADGMTAAQIARFMIGDADAITVVLVNGHFSKELSSIPPLLRGIRVESLATAIQHDPGLVDQYLRPAAARDDNAFAALSTAFLVDGAFIQVAEGVSLDRPVHLLSLASGLRQPFVSHPRNLIIAGKNSRVAVVESYVSAAGNEYWTNAVTDVIAAEGAVIEHDKVQLESAHAYHVGSSRVTLSTNSSFTSNAITLGGALVRNNVTALLSGAHAQCTLNGLSVATGTQLVDNHTTIDHASPACESHELYKSILDGSARGVFNGKIYVRKDAQKTDARQTNRTLLLSDDATIDTKPQLEIFADDVKCTHGATVGQLDEEQVFYLRSRGIGEARARDLLTFAFASDVVGRVHIESLRARLDALLHERLRQGRVANEE